MSERLNVSRERRFSAHHMLLGAAQMSLEDAKSKRPGWFFAELTALTMSGLALEAICNAVGERVITRWDEFESASPIAKLRLICDKLDVPFDRNQEPWSTALWLAKLRNEIAHAKPQWVKESYVWTREEVLSNVVDEIFGERILCPRWASRSGAAARRTSIVSSPQPPKPDGERGSCVGVVPGLPPLWLRLGGDEIDRFSPKATPFLFS